MSADIPAVIDTNVLVVSRVGAPAAETEHDSSPDQKQTVAEWLQAFIHSDARLALDQQGKIADEYRRNTTEQDIGFFVVDQKWQQQRVDPFPVDYDKNDTAMVPAHMKDVIHDHADRKFVAVALGVVEQHGHATVFNATDTDWLEWAQQLTLESIDVQQLLPEWLERTHARKYG